MKRYLLCLATCAALASTAYAASSSWTKTVLHNTVYSSNTTATMTFSAASFSPPLGLSTPYISGIAYTWNPYPNGNTSEIVDLCYRRPNAATDLGCVSVTGLPSGTVQNFNNENAKGTIFLKHRLVGGTYAAPPAGVSDTVTVNYVY